MSGQYHIPVLLHAGVQALLTNVDGIYADATFGGGGHSKEILKQLGPNGKLFCFDVDPEAKQNFISDLSATQATFIPQNFRYMQKFLRVEGVQQVDGIFADLGVSSRQFDAAERGFSFRYDAPLDMRMGTATHSAFEVINTYPEEQLKNIFSLYGQVRNAKQLAHILCNARTKLNGGIQTTFQLRDIATSVVKGELHNYLATVFQALRIEVNDEMGALRELLESSVQMLKPGGRIVVISYHSLEDRMVKNMLRTGNVYGDAEEDMRGVKPSPFTVITRKPVLPDADEIRKNSRSRSAKMRVGERR
ncbi:MAG: 16S rRNA (cytosine(1402)-N(4))-methyltransferase RsmH [Chitinophagales bacterium]